MNLPILKDIKELSITHEVSFVKFRILNQYDAFPCLLITAIENLMIKKYFSSAFEIFFGMLFEISEFESTDL